MEYLENIKSLKTFSYIKCKILDIKIMLDFDFEIFNPSIMKPEMLYHAKTFPKQSQ